MQTSTLRAIPTDAARRIVHQTRGAKHGPITRLVSPGDLGHYIKPFVFLDLFEMEANARFGGFGMHPHSGIATLTYMIEGQASYDDSTGKSGVLPTGGVEWMQAGGGVWHTGGPVGQTRMRGFQLWVALPPELENSPAVSHYLSPDDIPKEGPAQVLLGSYGNARSKIASPSSMNYLGVHLRAGERWRYQPPSGHDVAWIALASGNVNAGAPLHAGDMAVFEESGQAIDFHAENDSIFVLGSAVKHPHDLVMGHYSVHTSPAALDIGEAGIRRIATQLQAEGRL